MTDDPGLTPDEKLVEAWKVYDLNMRARFLSSELVHCDAVKREPSLRRVVEAAARVAIPPPFEAALLREALTDILSNVRYERDDDGNWHSFYSDKPRAAAATERARALTATEQGGSDAV